MVVLGGGAFSFERGTTVNSEPATLNPKPAPQTQNPYQAKKSGVSTLSQKVDLEPKVARQRVPSASMVPLTPEFSSSFFFITLEPRVE